MTSTAAERDTEAEILVVSVGVLSGAGGTTDALSSGTLEAYIGSDAVIDATQSVSVLAVSLDTTATGDASGDVLSNVENLLGVLPKVQAAQRAASSRAEANAYSVRNELMADCLAGVWAYWMNRRHANVDEADVRQAAFRSAKIIVSRKTIITPAARELASQHDVFITVETPSFPSRPKESE